MKHQKGNRVIMSESALENYGEEYRNKTLIVTHCANKSMLSSDFFRLGRPEGYHPGYDESVYPMGLYDFIIEETGEELNFSLYDWELE